VELLKNEGDCGKFFMLSGGQKAGEKEGARSATEGPMKKKKRKEERED